MKRKILLGIAFALFLGVSVEAAVDPVVVEVHYQNGVKFFKRGLYEKSIEEFQKTLELDPNHAEAKAYLVQVKDLQKTLRPSEAKASEDARIRELYAEGRRLYRDRQYEEAVKVYDEILLLKKIDDFASFYKEKCEGILAKRLLKEQSAQDKVRRREEAARARAKVKADRDEKRLQKAKARETVAAAKAAPPVPQENVEPAAVKEGKMTREERAAEVEARRDARRQAAEEKRAAAKLRREEKIGERVGRRDQVTQENEARRLSASIVKDQKRQEKVSAREAKADDKAERDRVKKLFLDGVRSYGRKDYQAAIRNFQDVATAEKKTGILYTHSAQRLMDKARKRLAGEGQDRTI